MPLLCFTTQAGHSQRIVELVAILFDVIEKVSPLQPLTQYHQPSVWSYYETGCVTVAPWLLTVECCHVYR